MRILWLAPTFRNNARICTHELRKLGAEVMLVTADLRYSEYDDVETYETLLRGRPIPWADWIPCYRTYRNAKRFQPDIVVTEILADPRWKLFATLAPRIRLVHDAQPHDDVDGLPWWNRMLFDRWDAKADATIVFSQHVGRALSGSPSPVHVAPLHSDLNPAFVPAPIPAVDKRNFVMFGRQFPYKNHAVVFAAWQMHVNSGAWRGDELLIYGDGEITAPLPDHCRWVRGDFKYRLVIRELCRAKGSIVHYTDGASQSGVQVLSLQLGVPPLVSTGGGLGEYQPDGLVVTDPGDVEGLARAIDALADPSEVERQSKIAAEHYQNHLDPSVFAKRFIEVASEVMRR